jgi:hypothetical protein
MPPPETLIRVNVHTIRHHRLAFTAASGAVNTCRLLGRILTHPALCTPSVPAAQPQHTSPSALKRRAQDLQQDHLAHMQHQASVAMAVGTPRMPSAAFLDLLPTLEPPATPGTWKWPTTPRADAARTLNLVGHSTPLFYSEEGGVDSEDSASLAWMPADEAQQALAVLARCVLFS